MKVKELYLEIALYNPRNNQLFDFILNSINDGHLLPYRASKFLRTYLLENDVLSDIYLYTSQDNILISALNGVRYLDIVANDNLIEKSWINEIILTGLRGWTTFYDSSGVLQIFYVNTPKLSPLPTDSLVLFHLNNNKISSVLSRMNRRGFDTTYLVDSNGHIAASTSKVTPYSEHYDYIVNTTTTDTNVFNLDENKIVSYCTILSESNWKLVYVCDTSTFLTDANALTVPLMIVTIFTLLLGVILTLCLSYYMHRPLKKLVLKFAKSDTSDVNEYIILDDTLNNLTKRLETLDDRLCENMPGIKNNFIIELLSGRISSLEEVKNYIQLLKLNLYEKHYACALIEIDKNVAGESMQLSYQQAIRYAIRDEIDRCSNNTLSVYCASSGNDMLVVLLSSPLDDNLLLSELTNKIDQYARFVLDTKIFVLYSDWVDDIFSISEQYRTIYEMRSFRFFCPEGAFNTSTLLLDRKFMSVPQNFWSELESICVSKNMDKLKELHTQLELYVIEQSLDGCILILHNYIAWACAFFSNINASSIDILSNHLASPHTS
ncbi:MAG TPA: hypothetical protein DIW17_16735, partial [Clostridiales bacterium]|nr:hypothetical protein [Clostridiales bacterium]